MEQRSEIGKGMSGWKYASDHLEEKNQNKSEVKSENRAIKKKNEKIENKAMIKEGHKRTESGKQRRKDNME